MLPEVLEPPPNEQLERIGVDRRNGIEQRFVNTGDEGNGAARYAGHHVGPTHGHSFEEERHVLAGGARGIIHVDMR